MKMPVRRFWAMSNNIHRIEAEREMRQLTLMVRVNAGKDAVLEHRRDLEKEIGMVVDFEPVFDVDGWSKLKRLAQGHG